MIAEKNKVLHINHLNFDKVISKGVILVDFWAEWCAPCHIQAPILDEVAAMFGGKAIIAKLNVDDNRNIAAKYGIVSIPTMIIFKDAKPIKQFIGVQPKQIIVNAITNLI